MDPKQPGFPTSPYYTPVSTSAPEASQTLDATTGQMGGYSIAGTNVSGTVLSTKRPAGTEDNQELPARKIVKTETVTTSTASPHTVADVYNLMQATQNTALTTAWLIQMLQSRPTGFCSTLLPVPTRPNPPPLSQPPQQDVKTESVSPTYGYKSPLLCDLLSPVPHKVPDWLKNQPPEPPLASRKRSAPSKLDDAIRPVGEPRKKAKATGKKNTAFQKKGSSKGYQDSFSKRAQELSLRFPGHPLDAEKLWDLCDYKPSAAAEEYLGREKFEDLPSESRMYLSDVFTKARASKKNATSKGIESLFGIETRKPLAPSPIPSSIISEFSTDTGYSTATITLSQQSSSAGVKPTFSATTTPFTPFRSPLARAVLTNPHKNRCFINTTIHYLKAVLTPEEQSHLIHLVYLPEEHQAQLDPALMAFARLYQAMEQFEGGVVEARQKVVEELDSLIITCLEHPGFRPCVNLKAKRKTRSDANSPLSPEQQLRQLEHDDASFFYMATWDQLRQLIPSMSQVTFYQEMQTSHQDVTFNKKTNIEKNVRGKDGCEPFLALKFDQNNSIQEAVNHYFSSIAPNSRESETVHWESQQHPSIKGLSLPKGDYPTKKTFRLGAHGFLNLLHLRFELQPSHRGASEKLPICKELRQQVFDDIRVPVEDLDSGHNREVTASPVCIIAHTGSDLKSGHYVTLEKTEQGWLLHDDGQPATLLENPARFLQSPPFFDPYLVAYETI